MLREFKHLYEIIRKDGIVVALNSAIMFFLPPKIQKHYENRYIKKKVSEVSKNTESTIRMNYNKNEESDLAKLCDLYGTDKGEATPGSNPYPWPSHGYSDFYELIFNSKRDSVENVLECGIGTNDTDIPHNMGEKGNPGASLRVWRDYFPNSQIIGINIDDDILFSEDRIETYCVDQTSRDSIKKFLNKIDIEFDIIIDDGLHEFSANVSLFESTINQLKSEGVYIIEDVSYHNLKKYQDYFINGLDDYYAFFVEVDTYNRPRHDSSKLIAIYHK